jgi:hypothetical protein
MVRKLALAAVAVGILLALGPPATAKCFPGEPGCPVIESARAIITGPGLDEPIVVSGPAFWELARRSGLATYRPGSDYAPDLFPGEDRLGPRYELRFVLRIEGDEPLVVVQDLYPYAPNLLVESLPAAWTFTSPGQRFVESFPGIGGGGRVVVTIGRAEFEVEEGWYRSASLFQTLTEAGLPKASPVSVGEAPAAAPTSSPAGGQGPPVPPAGEESTVAADPPLWRAWAGVGALAVLLVAGALWGRAAARPRPRTAAP